jgi:hypothetical protein
VFYFASEKIVLKKVAEIICKSVTRTDPEKRALKEKEGVFVMEQEQTATDAMIN